MTINGINQDFYLINNPIWITALDIDPATTYLEIVITDITNSLNQASSRPLRIYPFQGILRYNLQEVIKGNFPKPKHPITPVDGQPIQTNYRRFTISIVEIITVTTPVEFDRGRQDYNTERITGATATFTKTFIRGGEKTMLTNRVLQSGEILSPVEKIPRWSHYPMATYILSGDGTIIYNNIIPETRTVQQKVIGCDPLYIRFLNSKGGYSFWLFEIQAEKTAAKSGAKLVGFPYDSHSGFDITRKIEAETRVQQRHLPLIEDLMKSPEIHIYNKYGLTWAPVILENNELELNNYETVQQIALTFNTLNQETPSLTW